MIRIFSPTCFFALKSASIHRKIVFKSTLISSVRGDLLTAYSFLCKNWRILARKLPILGNQSPRMGSALARNLHFWGIKKEENSLNSLILVTISWRRKYFFYKKVLVGNLFLQKKEMKYFGNKKIKYSKKCRFLARNFCLMKILARN